MSWYPALAWANRCRLILKPPPPGQFQDWSQYRPWRGGTRLEPLKGSCKWPFSANALMWFPLFREIQPFWIRVHKQGQFWCDFPEKQPGLDKSERIKPYFICFWFSSAKDWCSSHKLETGINPVHSPLTTGDSPQPPVKPVGDAFGVWEETRKPTFRLVWDSEGPQLGLNGSNSISPSASAHMGNSKNYTKICWCVTSLTSVKLILTSLKCILALITGCIHVTSAMTLNNHRRIKLELVHNQQYLQVMSKKPPQKHSNQYLNICGGDVLI